MIRKTVGKYRVVERIGRGGMGIVYKAVDETLDREVALKVLNPELADDAVVKRFRGEAMTLARLNHPGIATLYELLRADDELLMVMEFVRGETFDRMIERTGPLPIARAISLAAQVLDALGHAHRVGIVHRDLKPANLMLTEYGAVKIMDFGIARVLGSEHLTSDGLMMGTPAYMAPEQVLADEIDARADLYSIGVVLYRLLSGNLPFKADTAIAMAHKQLKDPPTPLRQFRAGLPPWCEELLSRALAKSPADRFQTAEEFRDALVGHGALLVPVTPSVDPLETTLPPDRVTRVSAAVARAGIPVDDPTYVPPPPTPPDGSAVAPGRSGTTLPPSASGTSVEPAPAAGPSSNPPMPTPARGRGLVIGVGLVVLLALVSAVALTVMRRPAAPAVEPAAATSATAQPAASAPTDPSGAAGLPPPGRTPEAVKPPSTPAGDPRSAKPATGREQIVPAPPASPPAAAPTGGRASRKADPPRDAALPPLTFTNLRIPVDDGERVREHDAIATFALGVLTLSVKNGPIVRSIRYDQILNVYLSRSRQPMWQTPGGPAPVMRVPSGALGRFRSDPHWLAIRTKEAFVVLRLAPEHLRTVPAAFSERAGVELTTVGNVAR